MTSTTQKESRTVRETTAEWESNDFDGKVVSTEVTVLYNSPSIGDLKRERIREMEQKAADPTAIAWLSDSLLVYLKRIDGLPAGVSCPSPMTLEWLDEQDLRNLTAIRNAIDEDIKLGKSRPAA